MIIFLCEVISVEVKIKQYIWWFKGALLVVGEEDEKDHFLMMTSLLG
jgi:hypothetical protein